MSHDTVWYRQCNIMARLSQIIRSTVKQSRSWIGSVGAGVRVDGYRWIRSKAIRLVDGLDR